MNTAELARRMTSILLPATLGLSACGNEPGSRDDGQGAELLYVWAGDADAADPDFLAVIDVRPGSARYGQLIATVPVEGRGNGPHHTEYELTPGRTLFANGWDSGRTFIFDMSAPEQPRVANVIDGRGGYTSPHSYARLPNGNVLTTFQSVTGAYAPPGGLVELDDRGEFVRGVSGLAPGIPERETWPYSLLVLPDLDRVVTTSTRMGTSAEWAAGAEAAHDGHDHADPDVPTTHIQLWRLSDLQPLSSLRLPPQNGGHNVWTAEPRRLANGDVYVNTFSCGLYRITGIDTDTPAVQPALYSRFDGSGYCAVPVVLGNFWIQPSATERAIVAYDLNDAARPREAARLELDAAFEGPHWIALDGAAPRMVVTSENASWVLIVDVDPATGALSIDERFRERDAARPGLTFDRMDWPHGRTGRALPHGAVFSARPRS